HEICFILEMLLTPIGIVAIVFEEGKGLVMELEQFVGFPGDCIIPSAAVPGPGDTFFTQTIPDGGHGLRRHKMIGLSSSGMWCEAAEGSIDGETVRRYITILRHCAVRIQLDNRIRRRVREDRRASANQPESVQE